ncbi:hypothetical protein HON71_03630 [Candidatus Woesearchaeota archaeon]|jgi:hypothetical protein|nr:hypothetical protein [Candidatus Woesearchaeota archaeon]MBT5342450.1 hypothetical protein [Candidatus Woesearchaeota archaeon]
MAKIANKIENKVIAYAFTTGVIVALILGLISAIVPANAVPYLTSLLILAGIVVGFFNITPTETSSYVLFVTAIVVVTSLSQGSLAAVQYIGPYLESVLASIMAFIVPSVIVVGLRAVLNLAEN